jgi:hypothetical protein
VPLSAAAPGSPSRRPAITQRVHAAARRQQQGEKVVRVWVKIYAAGVLNAAGADAVLRNETDELVGGGATGSPYRRGVSRVIVKCLRWMVLPEVFGEKRDGEVELTAAGAPDQASRPASVGGLRPGPGVYGFSRLCTPTSFYTFLGRQVRP